MATYTYKTLAQTVITSYGSSVSFGPIYTAPEGSQAIIKSIICQTHLTGNILDLYVIDYTDLKGTIVNWDLDAISGVYAHGRFEDAGGNAITIGDGYTEEAVVTGCIVTFPTQETVAKIYGCASGGAGVDDVALCPISYDIGATGLGDQAVGGIYSGSPIMTLVSLTQYAATELLNTPMIMSGGLTLFGSVKPTVATHVNITVTGVEIT